MLKPGSTAWLAAMAAAQGLYWAGYSAYYAYTRMAYTQHWMVLVLVASENAPLLLSVAAGYAADRLGRRAFLAAGLAEALAVYSMAHAGFAGVAALAALAAAGQAAAYTALFGILLSGVRGSGFLYSLAAVGGSLGWALGGPLAGLLAGGPGAWGVYAASAALRLAGYAAAYAASRGAVEGGPGAPPPGMVARALGRVPGPALAAAVSWLAFGLVTSYAPARIAEAAGDPVEYGVAVTLAPALAGAAARPLAGRACDRLGPERLYAASALAYAALAPALALAPWPLLAALWAAPVYPFMDVAVAMMVSRRLPASLQATAAGVVQAARSLGGLAAAPLAPALRPWGVETVSILATALMLASIAPVAVEAVGAGARPRGPAPSPGPSSPRLAS